MKYLILAQCYQNLEETTKRLEKSTITANFIKKIPKQDIGSVCYLLQGRVFPQWDERKLGMSSKLLLKAISRTTGVPANEIEKEWSKLGDLGLVAEKLCQTKKQQTLFSTPLTLTKVLQNIEKLSTLEGSGTVNKKVGLIADLLSAAQPIEAKYIVRTITESLRTGVGDSGLRDAIVEAFLPEEEKKEVTKSVQESFDVTNDWGAIAIALKTKGLEGLKDLNLVIGKPIKVMLYPKVDNIEEGFESTGKPAIIEPKLDGFRCQIHKYGNKVKLFTRRLEEVSRPFPDIVKAVKSKVRSNSVILDTEIIGIDPKTKKVLPFQEISKRIRRKHDIEKAVNELPVCITIFDVIELNGDNLLKVPLEERKKKLKAIISEKEDVIEIIDQIVTDDPKKANKFYNDSLDKGHEGVMMKSVQGAYTPGKRVGLGVKVKPVMEALDVVIVAAEWGEGKRANWLSSFTIAIKEESELKTIGKVGTGIKEKSEEGVTFEELTSQLKPLIIQDQGKTVQVKPKVILEILFEEIQKSTSYSSGYALRFPRVHRLREDKPVSEIATMDQVEEYFSKQKKR
jgi:DNA ligase 1